MMALHRLRLGAIHLGLSMVVAAAVGVLVLGMWYPAPYRSLSGGLHLFSLLVIVDIALGPLATTVISRPGKPLREWRTDVSLIALVQCAALAYGLWTLYQARPVYMAFEIDRFRVVHAVDIPVELLARAPDGFRQLPLNGPRWVAVRPMANSTESMEATVAALQGLHLAFRPDFWMPYEQAAEAVRTAVKPLSELLVREPHFQPMLVSALHAHNLVLTNVVYLPLASRTVFWTALLDRDTLKPLLFLPIDPYGP